MFCTDDDVSLSRTLFSFSKTKTWRLVISRDWVVLRLSGPRPWKVANQQCLSEPVSAPRILVFPFMLLIFDLVFEPILMDIVPLFVASQYYCVLCWPGIVIPAATARPPNVMKRSTVHKFFVVIRSSATSTYNGK
jgi:hypothetical protein